MAMARKLEEFATSSAERRAATARISTSWRFAETGHRRPIGSTFCHPADPYGLDTLWPSMSPIAHDGVPSGLSQNPSELCTIAVNAVGESKKGDEEGLMASVDTKPYDRSPWPGWGEAVASWPWQQVDPDMWLKEGDCPRCGHYMSKRIERGTAVFLDAPSEMAPTSFWDREQDEPPEEVWVRCNCDTAHLEEKAGRGCGQQASVPFAAFLPERPSE